MPNPSKAPAPKKRKPVIPERWFPKAALIAGEDIDAKVKTAKRGELKHVRLSIREKGSPIGGPPFIVSYAEADGFGGIARYDRSDFNDKESALHNAAIRQFRTRDPVVIVTGF